MIQSGLLSFTKIKTALRFLFCLPYRERISLNSKWHALEIHLRNTQKNKFPDWFGFFARSSSSSLCTMTHRGALLRDPKSSRPTLQWGKVGFFQHWCSCEKKQEGTSCHCLQVFRSAAAGSLNSQIQSDLTCLLRTGLDGQNGPSLSMIQIPAQAYNPWIKMQENHLLSFIWRSFF